MTEYTKAITAAVALAVAIANGFGWEVPEDVVDGVIAILIWAGGVFGVYQLANKPKDSSSERIARAPALTCIGAVLLAALMLSGCESLGIARPSVDSPSDAVVVAAANITTVATEVHRACGNEEPGGPCLPGALIDTETKDEMRDRLQEALDALVLANRLLDANDEAGAGDKLEEIGFMLSLIREELASYGAPD